MIKRIDVKINLIAIDFMIDYAQANDDNEDGNIGGQEAMRNLMFAGSAA